MGLILGSFPGFHPNIILNLFSEKTQLFGLVFGSLFTSIIPGILMVPTSEMTPLLLPSQCAVQKGKMQEAIMSFVGGALLGCFLFLLTFPLYSFFIHFNSFLKRATLPFLIFTISLTISKSKNSLKALLFFLISGVYGIFMFSSGIDSNSLLGAHFTAMFGLVGLLVSEKIPIQKVTEAKINLNFPQAFTGFIGGLLISLFPAITPAQVYVILILFFGASSKGLAAAGALTLSSFLFSFQSLIFFGKGRMATVEKIGAFNPDLIAIYALFSFFMIFLFSRYFVKFVNQISKFREVSLIFILSCLIFFYPKALHFAVFSLILGLIANKYEVERVHLMGSLLLPTILWYLKL